MFLKNHPVNKIFNRNKVKIGYRTLPNLGQKITGHNTKILNKINLKRNGPLCNCRISEQCPMDGKCLSENIIYQANVTATVNNIKETKSYIGLTGGQFKARYRNHIKSFKNREYRNETCLSKFIWELNDKNVEYNIKWKIIDRANIFSPVTKRCNLCLKEKYYLIMKSEMCEINTRSEFGNKCRHMNQYLICNQ